MSQSIYTQISKELGWSQRANDQYPTLETVKQVAELAGTDKNCFKQLFEWNRFLTSPGAWAAGQDNFEEVLEREVLIMNAIFEAFHKHENVWRNTYV